MSKVNLEPELVLLNGGLDNSDAEPKGQRGAGRPRTTATDLAAQLLDDVALLDDAEIFPRRNELTGRIHYVDPTTGKDRTFGGNDNLVLPVKLASTTGTTLNEGRFRQSFNFIAERDAFAPHRDFLYECREEAEPSPDFERIAERYFNIQSDFINKVLTKFFIGCVARAMDPGCSFSWMLVLCAKQGVGKSAWTRSLIPHQLFAEIASSLDVLSREAYRLHTAWILEMPELEQFFASKQSEVLKNMVSIRYDEVRLPYQLPTQMPRSFAMVGTANNKEFLVDTTGNRRFVPVDIGAHQIPWRMLEDERAGIWSAALSAYEAGAEWELSPKELSQLKEYQEDFELRDPWHDTITTYTHDKNEVRMEDILTNVLSIPTERQHTGHRKRVGGILRSIDFETTSRRINGKSARVWRKRKPEVSTQIDF